MSTDRFRTTARRRMAWLLWFGLLLPVAQAVASMHGISHVRQESSSDTKAGLAQQAHCDLCLMAAAIGGSAPLAELPKVAHPAVAHELPTAVVSHEWLASPIRVYRSRAPPFASH